MKKLLIAILAVFATASFAQQAFPDIPEGHWAGDAVVRVADLGIVIGFPDGTYRGNESFTRYQMALVISRLLDVIQRNMDAAHAMTDADIASLRNALQELASDVAAQGVRLNAVEGAVGAISDDVVSNTARIEALEAHMNDMMSMSPEMDTSMLEAEIDAARVAADTAAAQAAAAAAAAGAASDAAAAAGAQANQNAASIDAINDLLALLNSDVEGLKGDLAEHIAMAGDMMGPEVDLSGVDRNASDIANIREFVILLRRDQVALRDRVSALEAADAGQADTIADLEARLAQVEEDLLVISGSIAVTYKAYRLSGAQPLFDVDRVWGINADRAMSGSNFSSGDDDVNDDGDKTDLGEEAQDRQDIEANEGEADVELTLNVGFSATKGATGSPRALNSFDSVITAKLQKAYNLQEDADDATDVFDGYVFAFSDIKGTYDPIGAAPLTFQFGESPDGSFTPYVFKSAGDGFVATVGSPDFLAFLSPTLSIAYGEADKDIDEDDATDDDYPSAYYRGVRGTLTPLSGDALSATGGFSFAQLTGNAGDNADALEDNETVTTWGVDGQIGVSILSLDFEFATESGEVTTAGAATANVGPGTDARSLFFVNADVDVASLGIPVLKSLGANYRTMPTAWFGVFSDSDDYVWDLDQNGFGVDAELGLFILDPLTFYFDSFSVDSGEAISALGLDAQVNLFAAFAIKAFYHQVSVDGTNVDDLDSAGFERNDNWDTGFGVSLVHDGASASALIPGVDIEAGYKQTGGDFDTTEIFVDADTNLKFGFIEVSPYAGFESITDEDAASDDTTTIKAGTGLKTDTLDVFLQPSLEAAVNFRSTSHTDTGAADFTATELQWGVGLNLAEFLFDNSELRVRYGSWSGDNVQNATNTIGTGDNATDISDKDDVDGTGTQSTTGYEISWDYYDLIFAYAAYTNDNAGVTGAAQAFKISYKVTF